MSFDPAFHDRQLKKLNRNKQKVIGQDIKDDEEEMKRPDSVTFAKHRKDNNECKEQVVDSRGALYDSQNMSGLTRAVKDQAGSLIDICRRYDFTSFATALAEQYCRESDHTFSWAALGSDVGVISKRKEQLCTMFGPIGMSRQ